MASIADPVTIDCGYLENLVRRAKYNNADHIALSAVVEDKNLVFVSKAAYDNLILIARQFANLRANLLNGGVEDEIIALLSQDDATREDQRMIYERTDLPAYRHQEPDHGVKRATHKTKLAWNLEAQSIPARGARQHDRTGHPGGVSGKAYNLTQEWADIDGDSYLGEYSLADHNPQTKENTTLGQFEQTRPLGQPRHPRICDRTIVLAGISDNTTHEDITKIVRGGLLLEVYIKEAEHLARVSFLQEEDAVHFYEHSRKNDLYINHKRISVKLADRHFNLPGYVANQISQGATRNLVIRPCDPIHTEDSIRDDLEHIYKLVVIKIEFIGGNCYIKTNSVHNAMYARTCMMSRGKYKGSKIEWDVDECQQPLEMIPRPFNHNHQPVPLTKKPVAGMRNRFATLRLDDDDNYSKSDDISDTSTELAVSTITDVSF